MERLISIDGFSQRAGKNINAMEPNEETGDDALKARPPPTPRPPQPPPPPPPRKPPKDKSTRKLKNKDKSKSTEAIESTIPPALGEIYGGADDDGNEDEERYSGSNNMTADQKSRSSSKTSSRATSPLAKSRLNQNPFGDDSDDNGYGDNSNDGEVVVTTTSSKGRTTPPPPKPSRESSMRPSVSDSIRPSVSSVVGSERPSYATAVSSSSSSSKKNKRGEIQAAEVKAHKFSAGGPRPPAIGDSNNMIYYKTRISEPWIVAAILTHTALWAMLFTVGYDAIPKEAFAILFIFAVVVVALLITCRLLVTKSRLSNKSNIRLRNGLCTPEHEADIVPDSAVACLACACVLEGALLAGFSTVTAGTVNHLNSSGFYSQGAIAQTLRFTPMVLLCMHRIMRPANRLDPMRTILEIELVCVCWDALDGSTLFALVEGKVLHESIFAAIAALMALWYISVGMRMATMMLSHLCPTSAVYKLILKPPLALAEQPTVDRTLQALRLRAIIIMLMAVAEFFAMSLRLDLWIRGELDTLQQDMTIKNILFLSQIYNAYDMYRNSTTRDWNSREIIFGILYPSRNKQLEMNRWGFIISFGVVSCLLTTILVNASNDAEKWAVNSVLDLVLLVTFFVYCRSVHEHNHTVTPQFFLKPYTSGFLAFPAKLGSYLGAALFVSLFGARVPAIYANYNNMSFETYEGAMLIVILGTVPIALYANFWSISYMLFRKEFTASPGNYNAIHDPIIQMVAVTTIAEGVLDVLSCATLMALAQNDLPTHVNNTVALFCLLELVNACQCFVLQVMLSGGHDDTPKDLVKIVSYLRLTRGIIDFGTLILRVVLWVQFRAVSSVFLIKNLYNLLHSGTQAERWVGVQRYPVGTLFSEFVPPADWYGLTKEQWRACTGDTIALQAQAGRRV